MTIGAPPSPATAGDSPSDTHVFYLYITGATARSTRAVANARRIFDQYLVGRYELQIVDIYIEPEKASEHQIVAAPTLVKVSPAPQRRIIGDLSDEYRILTALDLAAPQTARETP